MSGQPDLRLFAQNEKPLNPAGEFVLYWMTMNRRLYSNFALERAVSHAKELNKPLLILEALRLDYPHASRRLHAFVVQGMADNAEAASKHGVMYYPYVEQTPQAGKGLIAALSKKACVVVTDWYPGFFIPRMLEAAADRGEVLLEAVDSCGLLPLAAPDREYPSAYSFRRYMQKHLPGFLNQYPLSDPLAGAGLPGLGQIPQDIADKWPPLSGAQLDHPGRALAGLAIDAEPDVSFICGGIQEARRHLRKFLKSGLKRYKAERSQPALDIGSGLSPYLHFGHISSHEVFTLLAEKEGWSPDRLASTSKGNREGWWGMSQDAEAFLDQLITWRELGYGFSHYRLDAEEYESLPDWALDTLEDHAGDERPYIYEVEDLLAARTHDELWNAAQRQLMREGRMHNYMRMLWGKKIFQWSPTPQDALQIMMFFNDHFALDGRDPNSLSGIFWCLGRFDRPWPEREVFGKVRYMSSRNTAKKFNVRPYVLAYAEEG
jgi:deoxyribodipyrimidine photo-lyase